ncbi:hypothetical protein JOM56_010375 [Amanita muscaria]
MDSDGFFVNPNYGYREALDDFMKNEDDSDHDSTLLDREMIAIDRELQQYGNPELLGYPPSTYTSINPPSATPASIPPAPPTAPPASLDPAPPTAPPTSLDTAPPPAPKVSLPRAWTEPLPSNPVITSLPQCAQTAPPDVSRNTLTARRCTNKDASPSSFVKFMDIPVTMTREHIHTCLKDNRKWSTVDISNMEIFAIKNKDSTIVNVLKIKFKDDAQSTTVKRVLTTSISFGDMISRRCRPWYLSPRSN